MESPGRRRPDGRPPNRTIRYRVIADDLRRRVDSGELAAGALLPSEADLSAQHGASRVTVRRALEALRTEGLVDSRQGFGWFVAADPLHQTLTRLGTIEGRLRAAGLSSRRKILAFGFIEAPRRVRELLGERTVLEVRRLTLADDQPFALVTVWCPEAIGAELSRADVERATFLEQLPVPVGGATQTIGAEVVDAEVAHLLGVPVGSAALVVERVTRDVAGRPVLVSRHVFPAHRTRFAVELEADGDALSPSGLRLVE